MVLSSAATASVADTINFKDGRRMEATIIKRNTETITVDWFGIPITYWMNEIDQIAQSKVPVTTPKILLAQADPSSQPQGEASRDGFSSNQTVLIEQVLQLSGLTYHLSQLEAQAVAQFDQREQEDERLTKLSPEARAKFRQVIADAFRSTALYPSAVATVQKWFHEEKLSQVLAWLQSPLGQTITKFEVAPMKPGAIDEFLGHLERQPPELERLMLLQRVNHATGATELSLEATHAVMAGMARGFGLSGEMPLEASRAGATKELDKTLYRAQYRELFEANTIAQFVFLYRELSDRELEQYVEFLESDVGRWFGRLITDAFLEATAVASERMGVQLSQLARELNG
jgi:hypothetical protein